MLLQSPSYSLALTRILSDFCLSLSRNILVRHLGLRSQFVGCEIGRAVLLELSFLCSASALLAIASRSVNTTR